MQIKALKGNSCAALFGKAPRVDFDYYLVGDRKSVPAQKGALFYSNVVLSILIDEERCLSGYHPYKGVATTLGGPHKNTLKA